MTETEREMPDDLEDVEILVNGEWLRATFHECDWFYYGEPNDEDEAWWYNYFMLKDGRTVPEDIQAGGPLPRWRPL